MLIKKYKPFIIIALLILSSINVIGHSDFKTTDLEEFTFKQEIVIPFDTSLDNAKYQPIDFKVTFENKCYGMDELNHSIRVGVDISGSIIELESQVYNIEKMDENSIKSCSIVFLIPEEADGTEKYYVFYSSEQTSQTNYEKHISIYDSHYFFEPIPGQIIDVDYYGIKEKDDVVYAISQKGELLGNPISQCILKFKPGSKIVETNNIDQLGSFDCRYGINEEPGYYGSSWATKVKKSILVTGNLMTRVRIESNSPSGEIKTDNIYTYYHNPLDSKKIFINCYHEILKDIDIEDPSFYDGSYGGIVSIKSRSATIDKMNVGDILPEMYLYSEDDQIRKYDIPSNPDSTEKQAVLSTEADIDLGEKPWIALNDPANNKAHGLILDKNTGITDDATDGIQVKSWVKQNVKLPGLEADTGNIYIMRNNYEKNSASDTTLKKGFKASFNIEFNTYENEGYLEIDKESEIFKKNYKNIPERQENVSDEEETIQRFQLKTLVHTAPSFPLGTLLSALFGKNFSYLTAELYKDNEFLSSGSVGRISLASMDLDLKGKNIIEKIKTIINLFDWKNLSFFKKIIFPDLTQGRYIVKIYKENPLFKKQRQYIGYGAVDVTHDAKLDIYCTRQTSMKINVLDQEKNKIHDAEVFLKSNNDIIADSQYDESGLQSIYAPVNIKNPYRINVIYKGFLIAEKQIKLGILNSIKEASETFNVDLYDIGLDVSDLWGFAPEVDLNPTLTSSEMIVPTKIAAEKKSDGKYLFTDLPIGSYQLSMSYKSYTLEKNIKIDSDKNYNLVFPAEYSIEFNLFDLYGQDIADKEIRISKKDKSIKFINYDKQKDNVLLPPGTYEISVLSNNEKIAYQNFKVIGDKKIDLVTGEQSNTHMYMIIFGTILIFLAFVYIVLKKQLSRGLKLIVIALLIISIFTPWWIINGEENQISTNTNTLLYPPKIVTLSKTNTIISGDISQIPDDATMALGLLSILITISILFILGSIFLEEKLRKTNLAFKTLATILVLAAVGVFVYVIKQITDVGVGSITGSGSLDVSLGGISENISVMSNWGFGAGFYIAILALTVLIISSVYIKLKMKR